MVFVWMIAPLGLHAKEKLKVYENDLYFQKQILINESYTCQAVHIDRDWLLTAAHCVAPFLPKKDSCYISIIAAQGDLAQVSTVVPCIENKTVFLPNSIIDKKQKKAFPFDLALIHFSPSNADYSYTLNREKLSEEEFQRILEQDERLNKQWDHWRDQLDSERALFPTLYYTPRSWKKKLLTNAIVVPLWQNGVPTSLPNASQVVDVVYIGGKFPSFWSTTGFGVDHGNSGGAVAVLSDDDQPEILGILGIVSAKSFNIMNDQMRQEISKVLPGFGQATEHFFFHGFAEKSSLAFIERTLRSFGDFPTIRKMKEAGQESSLEKIKADDK